MFIQGDLQAVFDALYEMGVIDPVLKMDWDELNQKKRQGSARYLMAVKAINSCRGDTKELREIFRKFDIETMNFVALEVARELAEFTDRQVLH